METGSMDNSIFRTDRPAPPESREQSSQKMCSRCSDGPGGGFRNRIESGSNRIGVNSIDNCAFSTFLASVGRRNEKQDTIDWSPLRPLFLGQRLEHDRRAGFATTNRW